jgi:hypothetical protein
MRGGTSFSGHIDLIDALYIAHLPVLRSPTMVASATRCVGRLGYMYTVTDKFLGRVREASSLQILLFPRET